MFVHPLHGESRVFCESFPQPVGPTNLLTNYVPSIFVPFETFDIWDMHETPWNFKLLVQCPIMINDTKKRSFKKILKKLTPNLKKVLLVLRGVCSYTMNEQGQYLFASVTQSQNLHSSWAAVLLSNTNPNYTKNAYFYSSDTNFAQQYCCIFLLCYLQRKISTISFLQKVVTNVSLLAIIFVPSSKTCSIVSRIVTILFGNGNLNQVHSNCQ